VEEYVEASMSTMLDVGVISRPMLLKLSTSLCSQLFEKKKKKKKKSFKLDGKFLLYVRGRNYGLNVIYIDAIK
jgi:hypothetical protein